MNAVNSFCGSGTISSCSFCHTNQSTYNCGSNSADCSANQIAFQQRRSNAQCTTPTPQCTTNAACDNNLFCDGAETCNETDGCVASPPAGSTEGETLYGDNCASCHGADGSDGTSGEDIRGESASDITEAIAEVDQMQGIDLTADEIDAIAAFLGNGGVQDGDSDEMDHNGNMKNDDDGDGISDDTEGKAATEAESEDADEDGTPDYMDPDVTHFDSDNNDGSMILMTDEGRLEGAATIDEAATLPPDGKPGDVAFQWGFVQFTVTGVTPGGSVNITLRMPKTLPADAQYWKYDAQGYHKMDGVSVNGNEVTFTLTDDDNDGVIVDPGAVGVPVATSGSSSGGGGGGCSLQTSGNSSGGLDPAPFLILLLPIFLKGLTFRKDR